MWRQPLFWWRAAAWALGLLPLVHLARLTVEARLGANPVEFLEHYTGLWGLRLLLLTLALSPLRQLTGRPEPIRIRRLLGLWAYGWICLHFLTYLVFDLEGSLPQLRDDLIERRYITLGFSAWLMLLPLAITSTQGWQRWLKRRWFQLHRLIYPAALLGVLHFVWLVKADLREPLFYLAVLLALLAWRFPLRGILRGRFNRAQRPRS